MASFPCPFCGFASFIATCSKCGHDSRTALWWLSFADGGGFLGVTIVQASNPILAVQASHQRGANPGGDVSIAGPFKEWMIGPEWRDRLLTVEETDAIPDPTEARA